MRRHFRNNKNLLNSTPRNTCVERSFKLFLTSHPNHTLRGAKTRLAFQTPFLEITAGHPFWQQPFIFPAPNPSAILMNMLPPPKIIQDYMHKGRRLLFFRWNTIIDILAISTLIDICSLYGSENMKKRNAQFL
ncbi:hypothetical protein CEXT_477991 [Caerostris extrusa]|uniref:Uncharacterized protein n=1 Tax=Caerostris extrusa TaxID=172846 RepID=A0AAV4TIW7_CAEEX|nr:hypothetical protein CEXT_477991 [Caerostris extrusa]